jgi:hypothetical protein
MIVIGTLLRARRARRGRSLRGARLVPCSVVDEQATSAIAKTIETGRAIGRLRRTTGRSDQSIFCCRAS